MKPRLTGVSIPNEFAPNFGAWLTARGWTRDPLRIGEEVATYRHPKHRGPVRVALFADLGFGIEVLNTPESGDLGPMLAQQFRRVFRVQRAPKPPTLPTIDQLIAAARADEREKAAKACEDAALEAEDRQGRARGQTERVLFGCEAYSLRKMADAIRSQK